MNKSVKILKAGSGDSIIVHLDGKNILIDGGTSMPYSNNLKVAIQNILQKGEVIDLVIATHFDEDHINGLYRLLEDIRNGEFPKSLIKEFWFQIPPRITTDKFHSESTKIGAGKAKKVAELLQEFNWKDSNIVASKVPYKFDEKTKFWLLSPNNESLQLFKDKYQDEWESNKIASIEDDYDIPLNDFDDNWATEDNSISNSSSIAFILDIEGKKKMLFLGDAIPSIVVNSLRSLGYSDKEPLIVDYIKLSHHGSKKSLSKELLDLIFCQNFIISTSGSKNNHPNKKTFAHVLKHHSKFKGGLPVTFIFNYEKDNYEVIFSKKDFQDYNFHCIYSNDENGRTIEL